MVFNALANGGFRPLSRTKAVQGRCLSLNKQGGTAESCLRPWRMEAFSINLAGWGSPAASKECMSFRCPQCKTVDSLNIEMAIELPPDNKSQEITLQVVACQICAFRGLAVYEEARYGGAGEDGWVHTGYWVSSDAVDSVVAAISSCPQPNNPRCICQAHGELSQRNISQVWRGLLELERSHTFLMRLHLG